MIPFRWIPFFAGAAIGGLSLSLRKAEAEKSHKSPILPAAPPVVQTKAAPPLPPPLEKFEAKAGNGPLVKQLQAYLFHTRPMEPDATRAPAVMVALQSMSPAELEAALEAPERATGVWESHLTAFAHAVRATSQRPPAVLDRVAKSLNETLKDQRSTDLQVSKAAGDYAQSIITRLFNCREAGTFTAPIVTAMARLNLRSFTGEEGHTVFSSQYAWRNTDALARAFIDAWESDREGLTGALRAIPAKEERDAAVALLAGTLGCTPMFGKGKVEVMRLCHSDWEHHPLMPQLIGFWAHEDKKAAAAFQESLPAEVRQRFTSPNQPGKLNWIKVH